MISFVLQMYTAYKCWRIIVYNYSTNSPTPTTHSSRRSFPNFRRYFFYITSQLRFASKNQ